MSATDASFVGSIPAIYEQYLVPLLFEPYAADLARRVADVREGTLLEVAAGTGVVTRALLGTLPRAVHIIATDLNEGMVRVGQARTASLASNSLSSGFPSGTSVARASTVTWQQADAQKLPFADASAHAIVCQFGVMFMPDKPLAYREALRVLAASGRYLFNVWDRLERNEVSQIVGDAVSSLFPEDPPRFFQRTPFGYCDAELIRAELTSAGFSRVTVETVRKVTQAPSAEHAAIGMCSGTPLRGEIERRGPERLAEATAAATRALRARFGDGAFENAMSALVVTAGR